MPRKKRAEGTRAPNGASSIYLGTDGKWHGRVTVGAKDDGRPDRRHVERKTEAEVIRAVRALERERDSGKVRKVGGGKWTVAKWLLHWFEHIAQPNVRYKTQTYYSTAIHKYLVPGLGAHRLEKLEPEHVERFYAHLRKAGAKPSTLLQVHRTLRAALNEAEKRERIARNPIRVVRSPQMTETEIEPLTVDDAQSILSLARERRNGVRWAIALALGLRQGEALGLKWPDISTEWHHGCLENDPCGNAPVDCPEAFPTGTLTVRRALQRQTWQHGCDPDAPCGRKRGAECPNRHGGGLVIVEPKSRAGRRVVSLPSRLARALIEHQAAQAAERVHAANLWQDNGWVFAQPTGKPIDPRADYGEWKELLAAAGVREARLHDARHTAATFLLVLGVSDRAAMDVMGWSKADMAKRYMHVPDEVRHRIARQIGGLLWDGQDDDGDGTAGVPVPA